jgi:hypothetical protein
LGGLVLVALFGWSWDRDRQLEERNRMEQKTVQTVLALSAKTKELIIKAVEENRRLKQLADQYKRSMFVWKNRADSLDGALQLAIEQLPDTVPEACQPYANALSICQQENEALRKSLEFADSSRVVDSARIDTLSSTLTQATVTIATQDSTIKGLEKHLQPKKFLGLFRLPTAIKNFPLVLLGGVIGYAIH